MLSRFSHRCAPLLCLLHRDAYLSSWSCPTFFGSAAQLFALQIRPGLSAVNAQGPNHWTAREFLWPISTFWCLSFAVELWEFLNIKPSSNMLIANTFSFCRLSFHFVNNILWCIKVYTIGEAQFIYIVVAVVCAFAVKSKNLLPNLRSWEYPHAFF